MLGRATSGLPSSLLSREEACEGCGASGSRSDQCSSTVRFSVVTAQTAGAKSGPPVLHPRPLRAVVTQFRSSAPACDKANFQKSGTRSRQESHDEPKVQRTQSMTGKVAIPTRLTAEGYGGQSGSAYRRSGRFTYRESTRATGPAQAPARICPKRNVGTKMHDVRNNTVAVASATDDERLSDPLETRLNIHGLLKVWWWWWWW